MVMMCQQIFEMMVQVVSAETEPMIYGPAQRDAPSFLTVGYDSKIKQENVSLKKSFGSLNLYVGIVFVDNQKSIFPFPPRPHKL